MARSRKASAYQRPTTHSNDPCINLLVIDTLGDMSHECQSKENSESVRSASIWTKRPKSVRCGDSGASMRVHPGVCGSMVI